jgi:hypothetical protein
MSGVGVVLITVNGFRDLDFKVWGWCCVDNGQWFSGFRRQGLGSKLIDNGQWFSGFRRHGGLGSKLIAAEALPKPDVDVH